MSDQFAKLRAYASWWRDVRDTPGMPEAIMPLDHRHADEIVELLREVGRLGDEREALRQQLQRAEEGWAFCRQQLDIGAEEDQRRKAVTLRRHARLSEAVGIDPGYSVDATIDRAIELAAECARLRSEGQEDRELIDWLEEWPSLHRVTEIHYVVDGYTLDFTDHDDMVCVRSVRGDTLRQAILAARTALGDGADAKGGT